MKKILLLRFSAMGDVVLLLPVIKSLVAAHKDVEVTIVTRPKFAPFFYDIERVVVFPADVDYTYNGVFGLRDLFKALIRKGSYDIVIDMHDHIRTVFLRTLFKLFGTPVVVFNKGRESKKAFSRKENKIVKPLPHTVMRYKDAFGKAGFAFELLAGDYFTLNGTIRSVADEWLKENSLSKNEKWIGIAPFAMHTSKVWPTGNYATVIRLVLEKAQAKFFLFGGGDTEIEFFKELKREFPLNCVSVAGQLKIRQEIAVIKQLDLMLCMDSSNMHLAALAGTPLLSIWGGTHPDVGFGPFGKGDESVVQISRAELPCRPCSVYGREYCYVGGFPCLTRITPEIIAQQILDRILKDVE